VALFSFAPFIGVYPLSRSFTPDSLLMILWGSPFVVRSWPPRPPDQRDLQRYRNKRQCLQSALFLLVLGLFFWCSFSFFSPRPSRALSLIHFRCSLPIRPGTGPCPVGVTSSRFPEIPFLSGVGRTFYFFPVHPPFPLRTRGARSPSFLVRLCCFFSAIIFFARRSGGPLLT